MNRVLRRPMFRIGGSAGTGITSGLDAQRQKYDEGDIVKSAEETTRRAQEIIKKLEGKKSPLAPGTLPGFLTSFGLNLASATPTGTGFGGLAATAAKAAQTPFQTFQAAKLAERKADADRASDLFSTALASEYSLLEEKEKGKGGTEFERVTRANLSNAFYDGKIKQQENLLANASANERSAIQNEIDILRRKRDDDYRSIISGEMSEDAFVKDIIIAGVKNDIFDPAKVAEKYPALADLLYDDTELNSDGGRVGRQMGGSAMMPELSKAEEDQVQDLSFNELRARLPQSISNEVVQVIANSKQALLDFANIRDQQDVDQFNQRYNVSLNIAQEG
jgi:hypothetical protein